MKKKIKCPEGFVEGTECFTKRPCCYPTNTPQPKDPQEKKGLCVQCGGTLRPWECQGGKPKDQQEKWEDIKRELKSRYKYPLRQGDWASFMTWIDSKINDLLAQKREQVIKEIEEILGYCGSWDKGDIVSCRKKTGQETSMRVDVFLNQIKR